MPKKNQNYSGSLYSGNNSSKQSNSKEPMSDNTTYNQNNWYVSLTKTLYPSFKSFGQDAKFTDEQQTAIDFLQLNLNEKEIYSVAYGLRTLLVIIGVLVTGYLYLAYSAELSYFMIFGFGILFVALGFFAGIMYPNYPINLAETERKKSLAYIPEIINYIVMNMRLAANLERAIEFAATHGRGKIAADLRKMLWEVQIGKFNSIEEGLDDIAYRWGNYSDDFKHSLMLIRASLLESDAKKRESLLDKASSDVIEGSREKMDLYARQLQQPTVYLYYFGILLPLMLAIVLPIASGIVQNLPIAGTLPFFLIYDVVLPIGMFILASSILGSRPPTYVPPDIPENFVGLPPKNTIKIAGLNLPSIPLAILVIVAGLFIGSILDASNIASVQSNLAVADKTTALASIPQFTLPFTLPFIGNTIYLFTLYGILIGFSLAFSIYLIGKYSARKKVQDEIRSMEAEFKDSLYVLASRLGENRPIEDALAHAIEFLPKSQISNKIFKRILENITELGMTIDAAIFDPNFGAVREIPSEIIRGGMRVIIDSVQLGVNVAAISLINLSMQLRNSQKIDESLRRLLEDVTQMLKTMGTFIAPIVLGVVTSLQKIILNSISSNCSTSAASSASQAAVSNSGISGLGGASSISQLFCNINPAQVVSPGTFMLLIGIYVIEVVIILAYFNSQIEDTNNPLHTYTSIAYSLPIAIIIFVITSYIATTALSFA